MLRKVGLFAGLSDNEKSEVAERLQYAPFARGDVITSRAIPRTGYIMAFAMAEVLVRAAQRPAAGPRPAAAGTVLGEMALMTGDARTATVVAKTDVECWRLDRGSFQQLLQTRPEIAEEVKGDRRAARRPGPRARGVRRGGGRCGAARQANLFGRIRRFLGLGA